MKTHVDVNNIAYQTMRDADFATEFGPAAEQEVSTLVEEKPAPDENQRDRRDLRNLLWSSIDDAKSRDLDQVEFAEGLAGGDTRLLVAIADVDEYVKKGSAIDRHAEKNATSVYTGVKVFSMLPEELSTGLTSLNPDEDRMAIVTEMVLASDGTVKKVDIYRALVRNRAKLAYESIGDWLEGKTGVPANVAGVEGLEAQLRIQAESAKDLAELRKENGALEFGTIQSSPVFDAEGKIVALKVEETNPARELIANFMIAANVAMAQFLEAKGGPMIRRVVKVPKYWDRIVEMAEEVGDKLPSSPDSRALAEFLARRKVADPLHYPDLSLAVIKALGPGEYAVQLPGQQGPGHFGLAVQDYTHSTAPNRRFADLVTQRLVKAALNNEPLPYSVEELTQIAEHCTDRDSAARKVERKMRKVAAAVLLKDKVGEEFKAIVTGVTPKGTFARVLSPPVDGRVMRGEHGLRVGQKVGVRLIDVDPPRGFIDFARVH